jgi:hypothetical protein
MKRFILILILMILLVACEEEATPYPVDLPATATAAPVATSVPPVRYALAANTLGYVAEYDRIAASGQLEQLTAAVNPAELGIRYDIVATYGQFDGWLLSPVTPHVMLVFGDALEPQLVDIVRRAVNPQAIMVELGIPGAIMTGESSISAPGIIRTELANLGHPDGLQLVAADAHAPGISQIAGQLADVNIETRQVKMANDEIRIAFEEGQIHMAMVIWTTAEQQQSWQALFGEENTLELYGLPISYLAMAELTISLTPGGWPIARY